MDIMIMIKCLLLCSLCNLLFNVNAKVYHYSNSTLASVYYPKQKLYKHAPVPIRRAIHAQPLYLHRYPYSTIHFQANGRPCCRGQTTRNHQVKGTVRGPFKHTSNYIHRNNQSHHDHNDDQDEMSRMERLVTLNQKRNHGLANLDRYKFGFEVDDGLGNQHYRHEKSKNPWQVKGSYGYRDALGTYRHVYYVADKNGFRVNIKSNGLGLKGGLENPASTIIKTTYTPRGHSYQKGKSLN